MKKAIRVKSLNRYLQTILVTDPILKKVFVIGEVSNLYRASYTFFDLIEEDEAIHVVSFQEIKDIKDGDEILVEGHITMYKGRIQLQVHEVVPMGQGRELLERQKLKKKLEEEGLFDEKKKRPLPKRISHIALLTSHHGAAIHDFLHTAEARDPFLTVTCIHTAVQGKQAIGTFLEAMEKAEKTGADVVVISRGGGSNEDLGVFSEEEVVRAVAKCQIPTVTAIGHRVDLSLADLAADVIAITPTDAAVLLTPKTFVERKEELRLLQVTLRRETEGALIQVGHVLEENRRRLEREGYSLTQGLRREDLGEKRSRLQLRMQWKLSEYQRELESLRRRLEMAKSQEEILFTPDGKAVGQAKLEVGRQYLLKHAGEIYRIEVVEHE